MFVLTNFSVIIAAFGMASTPEEKFTLAGGDAAFDSRAKNIFAGLEPIEVQHIAIESSESVRCESQALMKPDPSDDLISASSSSGESAKFQVPSQPPPKRTHSSTRPVYEISPSKWKRYDLSDVSVSQLTEQSNQSAAVDFLSRFQDRADSATDAIDSVTNADYGIRHIFRKPDKKSETYSDAKQLVHVIKENVCSEVECDDVSRTQILSFADDELNYGPQTTGTREQFRRRNIKKNADRQVRSQISCIDDEDDNMNNINCVAKTEVPGEMASLDSSSHGSEDDDFSELAQLDSDVEQDEEGCSDDESRYKHHDSASEAEKCVPKDVDLDSI